jgi:hypothetical protein
MKCKDCPHFYIQQKPIKGFDFGLARCRKHNLVVDFRTMQKVNMLECVEGSIEDREQQQKA